MRLLKRRSQFQSVVMIIGLWLVGAVVCVLSFTAFMAVRDRFNGVSQPEKDIPTRPSLVYDP